MADRVPDVIPVLLLGEHRQCLVQGAGLVRGDQNQAGLVGLSHRLGAGAEGQKACDVVWLVLDVRCHNGHTVPLRRTGRGNGCLARLWL